MNKLFLIGNGFDLAHGRKTSYIDFLQFLITDSIRNFNGKNFTENDLFKLCCSTVKNEFSQDWIDSRIFKEIHSVTRFMTKISPTPVKKNELFNLNSNTFFIKDIFESSLHSNWSGIENFYFESILKALNNNVWQDNINSINTDFSILKKYLINYLTSLPSPEKSKIFEDIFRKARRSGDGNNIFAINFNYTNTLNIYSRIDGMNIFNEAINIHGDLDNQHVNPIIFGYGDEMDERYKRLELSNDRRFIENIKSFWYGYSNNYQNLISLLGNTFELHLIGMSCGLSDRVLLNYLFEHENCKKIQIYFYKKGDFDSYFSTYQSIAMHFSITNRQRMRSIVTAKPDSTFIGSY